MVVVAEYGTHKSCLFVILLFYSPSRMMPPVCDLCGINSAEVCSEGSPEQPDLSAASLTPVINKMWK